jgi:hypothetical protein
MTRGKQCEFQLLFLLSGAVDPECFATGTNEVMERPDCQRLLRMVYSRLAPGLRPQERQNKSTKKKRKNRDRNACPTALVLLPLLTNSTSDTVVAANMVYRFTIPK